jgi:hypothetical protein
MLLCDFDGPLRPNEQDGLPQDGLALLLDCVQPCSHKRDSGAGSAATAGPL